MKQFKSHRAYINSQLHILSSWISGDDSVLRTLLAEYGFNSCTELSDMQARILCERMEKLNKELNKGVERLTNDKGIGSSSSQPVTECEAYRGDRMTLRQRNSIIKITQYKLNWSIEATFSFIVGNIPALRTKLSSWEIKHSKMRRLYTLMSSGDADLIIRKLDKIQERDFMWSWIFENILTPLDLATVLLKINTILTWTAK